MIRAGKSFDDIAQNIAEVIDDAVSTVPRDRRRRVELVRHQILHALRVGYKAGRAAAGISKEAAGSDR